MGDELAVVDASAIASLLFGEPSFCSCWLATSLSLIAEWSSIEFTNRQGEVYSPLVFAAPPPASIR